MSRARRSLSLVPVLVFAAAFGVAGCSMDPMNTVTPVEHTNVQTSAPRATLERLEKMAPAAAAGEASGLTAAVVIRAPEDLGSLASTLPKDFDFASSMLVFIGKPQQLERRLDVATTVVLVEADARDAFTPGVSVTENAMASMIGLTFAPDACCRGTATPDEGDECTKQREALSNQYASSHLVLYSAPRIDQNVQVMVQHTPCAAP